MTKPAARSAGTDDHTAQVVLIVGASSGIGRETALRYAARGASVVLASRSRIALEDVAGSCLRAGAVEALVQPTDVADRDQVDRLFAYATSHHSRIDVVVDSAAVISYGQFVDVPAEVFDAVIRTNLIGSANVARAALGHFTAAGGGSLVIVGSVLGEVTVPYLSPYVVSKFAVTALIRVLQQETRALPGVKVSGVFPGAVNTPIYGQAANYTGSAGRPPPPVDDPALVAAAVMDAADNGPARVGVGIANPIMKLGFLLLPAVFDAVVGPMMRLLAISKTPVKPGPGNVLTTADASESRGTWDRFSRGQP